MYVLCGIEELLHFEDEIKRFFLNFKFLLLLSAFNAVFVSTLKFRTTIERKKFDPKIKFAEKRKKYN